MLIQYVMTAILQPFYPSTCAFVLKIWPLINFIKSHKVNLSSEFDVLTTYLRIRRTNRIEESQSQYKRVRIAWFLYLSTWPSLFFHWHAKLNQGYHLQYNLSHVTMNWNVSVNTIGLKMRRIWYEVTKLDMELLKSFKNHLMISDPTMVLHLLLTFFLPGGRWFRGFQAHWDGCRGSGSERQPLDSRWTEVVGAGSQNVSLKSGLGTMGENLIMYPRQEQKGLHAKVIKEEVIQV